MSQIISPVRKPVRGPVFDPLNPFGGLTNYLYMPGVNDNYASTPDSATLSITGDIDVRCKLALNDWSPAAAQFIINHFAGAADRAFRIFINISGTVGFQWSANGSTLITKASTVATGITDGETKWIRVTLDVDNGAAGNDVKFYTSDDGISWSQLGTTVTTAGTTSLFDSTAQVEIGASEGAATIAGKIYRAQIYDGIGGTLELDANFSLASVGDTSFTESSVNAATVTINTSGGDPAAIKSE